MLRYDVVLQSCQDVAKRLQQMIGRGMIARRVVENLLRRLGRVDFRGGLLESLLVRRKSAIPICEQLVQRDVDHLFVQQLFLKQIGADPKIAVRARQEVVFQKALIAFQGRRWRHRWLS